MLSQVDREWVAGVMPCTGCPYPQESVQEQPDWHPQTVGDYTLLPVVFCVLVLMVFIVRYLKREFEIDDDDISDRW